MLGFPIRDDDLRKPRRKRSGVRVEGGEDLRGFHQPQLPQSGRGRFRRDRDRRRVHDQEPERSVDLWVRLVVLRVATEVTRFTLNDSGQTARPDGRRRKSRRPCVAPRSSSGHALEKAAPLAEGTRWNSIHATLHVGRISVAGHGRIHELGPGVDSAPQVVKIPETLLAQKILCRGLAADSMMTMEQDRRVPIQAQ